MYTVVNWSQQDGNKAYAVMDTSTGGIEFVSESDLALLTFVGLSMKTIGGEDVRLDGDTLVCDVEEYVADDNVGNAQDEEDAFASFASFDEEEDGEEVQSGDSVDDDAFDIYASLDEDDTPEGSVVSKLYEMLNPEQITVLRRYYLWYSQRLFTNAQSDKTYGLKSKAAIISKSQKLNNLRQGGDYRYAGWLDTGSIYAGYTCSLGHRLRYLHLAWDITVGDIETCFFGEDYNADYDAVIKSNGCIVFGEKCVTDFFEVDSKCQEALRRTQSDSLKDMQIIYEAYCTGNVQEIKDSFKLMDSVIAVINRHDLKGKLLADFQPTIPFSVVALYNQFRKVDLIPPKSLIQEIRSCLVGWTDGSGYFKNKWAGFLKYPDPSFYERLKVIARSKEYHKAIDALRGSSSCLSAYGRLTGFKSLCAFVYLLFTYEICGYYKYTATKEGFNDEGGYSKSSVGRQLPQLYNSSMHKRIPGGGFDMDTFKSLIDFAAVCVDADAKYRADGQKFEVPYFSEMSGQVYTEDLRNGVSNRMRSILNAFMPDGVERNRAYAVINFMSNVVFQYPGPFNNMSNPRVIGMYTEFKPFVHDYTLDLDKIAVEAKKMFQEFDEFYDKLLAFAQTKAEDDKADFESSHSKKAPPPPAPTPQPVQPTGNGAKTMKEAADFLLSADLSGITEPEFQFAKTEILETLRRTGMEPTSRQFYHLKPLYERVSGVVYDGSYKVSQKTDLSTRQDIKMAINWIENNPRKARDAATRLGVSDYQKLVSILSSIQKYGQISTRQMPYAEKAIEVMNEGLK